MRKKLLDELTEVKDESFLLKEIEIIDENTVKELIGKHIKFTKHNRQEKSKVTLPGKVIDYKDGLVLIYEYDIIYEPSEPPLDDEIENISINDISNVVIFDEYNKDFVEGFTDINNENFELIKGIYKITNIYNKTIEGFLLDADSFNIDFVYKNKKGFQIIEYPLYLINSIEIIKEEEKEYE